MARRLRRSRSGIVAAVLVLQLVVVAVPERAAGEADGWRPPLDAPVADPFRPPSQPWGAGNRGLAYRATHGQAVHAVDDGVVRFAGPVAGRLHVTVDHGSGLWSTYADLAEVVVVGGQRVAGGQVVGAATAHFHLTARLGGTYVDPALLLAGAVAVPELQPSAAPRHGGARAAAAVGRAGDRRSVWERVGRWAADRAGDIDSGLRSTVELAHRAAGSAHGSAHRSGASGWRGAIDAVGGAVGGAVRTAGDLGRRAAAAVGQRSGVVARWAARTSPVVVLALANRMSGRGHAVLAVARLLENLPSRLGARVAAAVRSWHRADDCTPDDRPLPPPARGRVLVQVAGLGTSHDAGSIAHLDAPALGYDRRDVVGFSYAGGCTPVPYGFDDVPEGSLANELTPSPYGASDTNQDIEVSAHRLADLIDEVHEARPGAPIDVAAHSLGGVVARRALEILAERHAGRPPVSVVLTIGSPHQGTELAGAATVARQSVTVGAALFEFAPDRWAQANARSVERLARGHPAALDPPGVPPGPVRVVSVAAPGDLVVPAHNSRWPGAVNAVVAGAWAPGQGVHGDLVARPEVHRELALAVAGLPARCVTFLAAVGAALTAGLLADVESVAAGLLLAVPL